MIQEVVGTQVGHYYLPAFAGVAFSNNEFRWSPRHQPRRRPAAHRARPRHARRRSPRPTTTRCCSRPASRGCAPTSRPRKSCGTRRSASTSSTSTRTASPPSCSPTCCAQFGSQYPMFRRVFSACDGDGMHPVGGFDWDGSTDNLVASFEGLAPQARRSSPRCARCCGCCASGSAARSTSSSPTTAPTSTCCSAGRSRPGRRGAGADPARRAGRPRRLHGPAVRLERPRARHHAHRVRRSGGVRASLGNLDALRDVGRAVGRLNKLLPKRQFVLIGPGRWGSRGDIKLGVPRHLLGHQQHGAADGGRVAPRRAPMPELSFGTHFFQDLVESAIRYLPLYPDETGVVFNRDVPDGRPEPARGARAGVRGPGRRDPRHRRAPQATGGQVLQGADERGPGREATRDFLAWHRGPSSRGIRRTQLAAGGHQARVQSADHLDRDELGGPRSHAFAVISIT